MDAVETKSLSETRRRVSVGMEGEADRLLKWVEEAGTGIGRQYFSRNIFVYGQT